MLGPVIRGWRAVDARMSRTLVETLHIIIGLVVAALLTWAIAWAYPLGADVAWACGIAAMGGTVVMGVGPLRRARLADRTRA
jgi:hypothetical protein